MICRFFICFLVISAITFNGFAQDILKIAEDRDSKKDTKVYDFTSLDGKSQKLKVIPDYHKRVLRVTCLGDAINIKDYWGVPPDISILNKNFIAVKYAIRGGSNLGLGNLLIVCVNNGKLHKALFAQDYVDSETGQETQVYNIKTALNGESKGDFQLYVSINDQVKSSADPENNYDYNERTVLHFDNKRNVFYSVKKNIYKRFFVENNKKARAIRGNFPLVILGEEQYYFINGDWFEMSNGNHLYKFE